MKSLNGPPSSNNNNNNVSSDCGAISSDSFSSALVDGVDGGKDTGGRVVGDPAADVESPTGLQRKGLRVSFPEFEVVSGYMDPPRPWNDVSKCSTDELVASYLNACNKVGVKPNARLLSQLQVITNFDDRNETLTLKNENFDARHCETLEEVFRRVQFRTVDLEAAKLEEEGAVTIFDMIEYYESCVKLNISYCKNLGQRGWQACSRMIRKTPCLENLEARGAVLSDFVMPILGRSLRVSSSLTSLHLEFTSSSGKPLQILVAALKVNETLKELYLADNRLMPSDGVQLGSLLRYNRTLHLLDLRNNHLQDTGFQHVCEGIWEQGKGSGLNTLVIWNNQLSYVAMNHLSRALSNSSSLETVNLGHNNLTNEGMHRLKESLLMNKTLLRIGLQAAKISCEGAVALAEFIAESVKLVRLDLRENEIKTGGLMALSLALKVSQSVTRIDLDKDPKKESGVKDYAEQQKRLLNDIAVYTQRNRTLARRREDEETVQEIKQFSAPKSDEPKESNPVEEEKSREETAVDNGSNCKDVRSPEDVVEPVDCKKEVGFSGGDLSPRHRMSLTLKLKTRCEMLESPDFVPESEMPPADLPPENTASTSSNVSATKRKVMMDIPPSPMVSSHGKTVLVPVLAGPLSPSFDEEMSSGGGTKSEDFAVDSISHPQDRSFSCTSGADESILSVNDLSDFWKQPASPLFSSLGLSSSYEGSKSPVPSAADSHPAHHDNSLNRLQNKKSSLKMIRPKHRFQVSKGNFSHKPTDRRGSGGSHRTPHVTAEHSRNESALTPSLVTALTAFQSAFSVPFEYSRKNSDSSKASLGGFSFHSDSLKLGVSNFPSVENQNPIQVDSILNVSTEPLASQDVASSRSWFPSSEGVSTNPDSCINEDKKCGTLSNVENFTETAEFDSFPASDFAKLQCAPSSLSGMATNDIIPESEYTSALHSGEIESFRMVGEVNKAKCTGIVSCIASDDVVSIMRNDKADINEKNTAADHQELCKNNDLIEKSSLLISNGLTADYPEDVVNAENLTNDVHKMHLEKARSNSDDFLNVEKFIV